jgi:hypothetical protein
MRIKLIIAILILIGFSYGIAISNEEVEGHFLQIKHVIVSNKVLNNERYIDGEQKYPEFKSIFNAHRYYIKKEADLIFSSEDINLIIVNKISTIAEDNPTFGVTIQWSNCEPLQKASGIYETIGRLMAISIGEDVIAIPTAFETIGKESILILRMPLKNIEKEFRKISKNIIIEPNKVPEIFKKLPKRKKGDEVRP